MNKIKLNISGNLVGITIPSTTSFESVEKELKRIVIKNYNLLKTLKFYKFENSKFSEEQLLELEKIITNIVDLRSISKITPKDRGEKTPNCIIHYGNLRSGEKINSCANIIIMGNLNPGSYVKSKKSIFVYGKARGTLHAGSEQNKYQRSFIYIEEAENPKVRIGETQLVYEKKVDNKNKLFYKKYKKIIIEKLNKNQVQKLVEKLTNNLA
jgi:septum site-determining protein MinC